MDRPVVRPEGVPDLCAEFLASQIRQRLAAVRGKVVQHQVDRLRLGIRGVPIYPGTDYGCFYGPSLHWGLEFLTQAGLSTLDVLRSATKAAAEAVGAEDDLGTLKPGKLADIVLLDANPLDDIRNTQKIWRVIKGGLLFDPDQLREQQAKN